MSAPRIVIAAGGTAGHVVPAIAVADALRAEGAQVSFVGGERAEAELVPAAGYPLDPIRVEGISRSNPLKAARAVGKAARALRRRARDPAPRGGPTRSSAAAATSPGRSALAAVAQRIPLVLTEADSHLGPHQPPARRPRARASASRSRSPGRDGDRYLVTGPARAGARRGPRRSARARSASTRTSRACSSSAARSAPARSTTPPPRRSAVAPYRVLHIAGRARLRRPDRARPALRPARLPDPVRPRARGRRPRRRPRRRLDLRARPVRRPGGPDPVSARHRGPPDRQRPLDGATAARPS